MGAHQENQRTREPESQRARMTSNASFIKKMTESGHPGGASLRAFWKGTSLQAFATGAKGCAEFKTKVEHTANKWIEDALRAGTPLAELKATTRETLDGQELALCANKHKYPVGLITGAKVIQWCADAGKLCGMADGEMFYMLWFINIAIALRLKVVEDDNDHGWLAVSVRT